MEGRGRRNWLELPPELTSLILHRLGAFEILENAQKVCRSWRDVCREASMWQIIDMNMLRGMNCDLEMMCRHAIDRSQGGLVDINIGYFGTDDLLQYIANSSSNLRRLRFAMGNLITNKGLAEAVVKLPLLEDLEVLFSKLTGESVKVIGQSCPNLKTLKLTDPGVWRSKIDECEEDALAIAENMPGLRHLQLFGNNLTNTGLNAIVDKCLHLEHIDLCHCFNIKLAGNLEKRCSEMIKLVRRLNDSTNNDDYTFDTILMDS